MSAVNAPRHLVVDDELLIRRLVSKALVEQGFTCDTAADGEAAAARLAGGHFDLLITDLKMPNRNGHALVSDVVQSAHRPVVIVHTGVIEPRLARDLFERGVDDIVYKPADVFLMAAKARAMIDRRAGASGAAAHPLSNAAARLASGPAHDASADAAASHAPGSEAAIDAEGPVTMARLNERLAKITSVLPISHAALDVYNMTRNCDWRLSQIAAAIQRDASLTAEVLRLANSSFYNPASKRVLNLDHAVLAIGQQRIGEMAVAINALSVVTHSALPWMDLELAWKRSMAAGIAIEAVVEAGNHRELEAGLPLAATMYPLGRVVLGVMFPELYERMIAQCWHADRPLRELERQVLPITCAATLAQLLAAWRIPPDVCLPLKHAADDYAILATMNEPLRTKAELMKVALTLGRLAVDRWETWDAVEFPPDSVLARLKLPSLTELVGATRADVERLADFCPGGGEAAVRRTELAPRKPMAYCQLAEGHLDLFAELLPVLGCDPHRITVDQLRDWSDPVIVNAFDAPPTRFAACRGSGSMLVVAADRAEAFARFAPTIALPCSYGRLRDAIITLGAGESRPVVTGALPLGTAPIAGAPAMA